MITSLILLLVVLYTQITYAYVTVNMSNRFIIKGKEALKHLAFCLNCPNPEKEGSVMKALVAKHGLQEFDVTGELVYCFPNHGESLQILNRNEFRNKIVLVDRGKVSILQKAENILGVSVIMLQMNCVIFNAY